MAVQKRRQSKGRSASRRAQWMASVKVPNVSACPRCQELKLPHRVCAACGYYHDREVLVVQDKEV